MAQTRQSGGTAAAAVVFDVGNVLLDWDPRYLYSELIPDPHDREHFLTQICSPAWIVEQDRGRSFTEAVAQLSAQHPEHAELIAAFDTRWEETLGGTVDGSVALLAELRDAGVPRYALTNFAAEKFSAVRRRYAFFGWFDGIVVSAEEGLVKPDPRLYRQLLDRYGLDPAGCVFVDDNPANVSAARELGMTALQFFDPVQLRADLVALDLPVTPTPERDSDPAAAELADGPPG